MTKYQGSLTIEDYHLLIEKKYIHSKNFSKIQIQPSSIDLTLSEECYEISASFLSSSAKIRENLKDIVMDRKLPLEERFKAQQKLSKLPRNSSKVRIRNRCQITGRPHGVYRKLKISRIALRQLGLEGKIPGMIKSSW